MALLAFSAPALFADEPAKTSAAEHAEHAQVLEQQKELDAAAAAHHAHQAGKQGKTPGMADGMNRHHDFSDAERWAKVFDDPARNVWQKPQEVVNLMEISGGMTVADLGAGTGFFLGFLAAAVGPEGKVWGLDPEPNMVDYMKKKAAQADWKQVDAKIIPFDAPGLDDASTDRILIVDTWHHIEERGNYSKKLAAALKPGGAVFVVDFTMDSPVGPHQEHRLAPEVVMEELEAGGFEVSLLEESLPNQYIVKGQKAGGDCGCSNKD